MRAEWRLAGGFLAVVLGVSPGWAGGLAGLLRDPQFRRLELAPLAPVLAATVATTYPVASASSSVVYVYNPALDTLERQARVAGPIIGERAETIGRGQFNLALGYSYVHPTSINGDDLDALVNRSTVGGRSIVFPVPDGVELKNGRFTNFLPVRVTADLDLRAQIIAPSLTYGITPDLDVNVYLPLILTTFDVSARTAAPDPRQPDFTLASGVTTFDEQSASDGAFGIGDILLRGKYVVRRGWPVDAAVALGLSVPSGSQDDFHGTGTTRVQPSLVLSRTFGDRFEPLLNAGFDLNAADVSRSVFRWVFGSTARVGGPLTAALVFLGRHEFSAPADPIAVPFFFQIERSDMFDASVGLRYRFAENGFASANVIVPLNSQGVRAAAIPTVEIEYAFSTPW